MLSHEEIEQIRQIIREELNAAPNGNKLLNFREVQNRFGISRAKLYRMKDEGRLFPVKLGGSTKWRESDLRSVVNSLKAS